MKTIYILCNNNWDINWYFSTRENAVNYYKENKDLLNKEKEAFWFDRYFIKETEFIK